MLSESLTWYLEDYLKYPDGASKKLADAVIETLKEWGNMVYSLLFSRFIDSNADSEEMEIRILSDSAAILSWPWEAVCSEAERFPARHCAITRTPISIDDVPSRFLEYDGCIHILYIISRPLGTKDINYLAFIRDILEYIEQQKLPVKIDVLRPPTYEKLQQVLESKPNYYHIIHFDGHGSFIADGTNMEDEHFAGGYLLFERKMGEGADYISAKQFGYLLSSSNIRLVALNACRSAMVGDNNSDVYASVAASILKAGVQAVVAMGYVLYDSGAKQFLPAFYQSLFSSGSVKKAIFAGRRNMMDNPDRLCTFGKQPLHDWLVPEIYTRSSSGDRILPDINMARGKTDITSANLTSDNHAFIGRGQEVYKLDKFFAQSSAICTIVHGMNGVGKTCLIRFYLEWLRSTQESDDEMEPAQNIWIDFRNIHSIDDFVASASQQLPLLQHQNKSLSLESLVQYLNAHKSILVWDNFEYAAKIGNDEEKAQLVCCQIRSLVQRLQNGISRIIIISTDPEIWLDEGRKKCRRFRLDGLNGEDLYAYLDEITPCDKEHKEVRGSPDADMEIYDGNPQLIQIAFSEPNRKIEEILNQRKAVPPFGASKLLEAYGNFCDSVEADMAPVLSVVGLFSRYLNVEWLESIVNYDHSKSNSAVIDAHFMIRCMSKLERAGLCVRVEKNLYHLHPALYIFLNHDYAPTPEMKKVYARCMFEVVCFIASNINKRNHIYAIHEANITHAKAIAEEFNMTYEDMHLTLGLASYANDTQAFEKSRTLNYELSRKAEINNSSYYANIANAAIALNNRKSGATNRLPNVMKSFIAFPKRVVPQVVAKQVLRFHKVSIIQTILYGIALLMGSFISIVGALLLCVRLNVLASLFFRIQVAIGKFTNNNYILASGYNYLASVSQQKRKSLFTSIKYREEALSLFREARDPHYVADTLADLAKAYVATGEARNIYLANQCITESLQIARFHTEIPLIAKNYSILGDIAYLEGDLVTARNWYRNAEYLWTKSKRFGYAAQARMKKERI